MFQIMFALSKLLSIFASHPRFCLVSIAAFDEATIPILRVSLETVLYSIFLSDLTLLLAEW